MPLNLNDIYFFQVSENAVSIEFGHEISKETLERITRINQYIKQNPFSGLFSTIPAYTTLTLYFNPVELMNDAGLNGVTCLDKIKEYIKAINVETNSDVKTLNHIIHMPVC